jgi:thiol-disulfide isomerase/thioredoxin
MPVWIRNALFAIAMLSAMIIGMRVYMELQPRSADASQQESGQLTGTPETLPEFILNDVGGDPRNIHEWADQPLLINFWATWCAPCRREIPLLQQLHTEKSVTGIQVIGVAIDNPSDVQAFLGEFGVSYPNLVGEEDAMEASTLFGIDNLGLPFSVLVAADGNILTVHIGEFDVDQLAKIASVSTAYEAGAVTLQPARDELAAL